MRKYGRKEILGQTERKTVEAYVKGERLKGYQTTILGVLGNRNKGNYRGLRKRFGPATKTYGEGATTQVRRFWNLNQHGDTREKFSFLDLHQL